MAPLKSWAPNERLTSGDLNAAFAEVAANRMPGVFCEGGAAVTFTAGQSLELPPGAPNPAATWDPAGYWNGATSRLVVPAGLGGLHIIFAGVSGTGGAKGDLARIWLSGAGVGAAPQQFPRYNLAGSGGALTAVAFLAVGAIVYVNGWSETAGTLKLEELTMVRLATLGLY